MKQCSVCSVSPMPRTDRQGHPNTDDGSSIPAVSRYAEPGVHQMRTAREGEMRTRGRRLKRDKELQALRQAEKSRRKFAAASGDGRRERRTSRRSRGRRRVTRIRGSPDSKSQMYEPVGRNYGSDIARGATRTEFELSPLVSLYHSAVPEQNDQEGDRMANAVI